MAHIEPLSRSELPQHEDGLAFIEKTMGFVPNTLLTLARVPGLLEGFQGLAAGALGNRLIPHGLKQLIGHVASGAAGCRYCQAHTGHRAEQFGESDERIAAVWSFETSDLFDDGEKAALRLALHASQIPNLTSVEDFAELKEHWSDDQITAIVAVVAFYGFLNRFNDTMFTTLEPEPLEFGNEVLVPAGWTPGKHA